MELFGVIFMIFAGGGLAIAAMIAIGAATRAHEGRRDRAPAPDRSAIAASILFNLLLLGGVAPDEALREIRKRLLAPVTRQVDIASWAERFAHVASPQQRQWLLETAVQMIAEHKRIVPLRQYAALLDLSFALGFQTDALAKLRERYGFDYVDHAKHARPREADRAGGAATTFFVRDTRDAGELLRVLEIDGAPSRQVIITAYRRLVAQHHPDKVHEAAEEVRTAAAARFIEITRAYETLMSIYRD
ncbi:MAG TPA: DnaJ domain-containing protein [Thermoanaerobaculia bacterium]|nr:DnaJ domain-containing protein [Thermoanaerobaculia bacterium]